MKIKISTSFFLLNVVSEEFDFFSHHFAEQHVGKPAGSKSEPFVGQPLFSQDFLDDGVIGECIGDGVQSASRFETYLIPVLS